MALVQYAIDVTGNAFAASSVARSGDVGVPNQTDKTVTNASPPDLKISLFRSLFRGREDVYPVRFQSRKTGRVGYAPRARMSGFVVSAISPGLNAPIVTIVDSFP